MTKSASQQHLRALIGLLAAAALLTGCAQSEPSASPMPSATSSEAATGSPATGTPPTEEQTAWAGDVCSSTSTLKTDVQGLVSTVAAGGDDVSARLNTQMETIKDSAAALAATIKAVPRGSEDDPEVSAVRQSSDNLGSAISDLEASVASVEGATGTGLVVALGSVAGDAGASLTALASTVTAIGAAAADGTSTVGQAFDAAPECSSLTR
ncbi:hypothetical protein [Cryobacterium sp. TMT3-29-2]|uniref:hypothetical protein n=1 Tax=Cryobacterium sp. TMT3-29-2 TaxID=2555867 RepID=UPI0010730438|nr:hypothetical protein [Cryobacterium sp. TMT3-29-2]TFC89852.1 hypothetical protein E3O67_06460 [Cryobacterium sp. TMT3-29-2]